MEEIIKKFDQIKELMKDYQKICGCEKCNKCPFNFEVAYTEAGSIINLCDALDMILD